MKLNEGPRARETKTPAWSMLNELSEIHSQRNKDPSGNGDERKRLNFPFKRMTVGKNEISPILLLITAADAAH